MKTYSQSKIQLMGGTEFTDTFKVNSYVVITLSDGAMIEGRIQEIGLAANFNPDTRDHLPVSIKVCDTNIDILKIQRVDVY